MGKCRSYLLASLSTTTQHVIGQRQMSHVMRKLVLCYIQTTKTQISLRICAV